MTTTCLRSKTVDPMLARPLIAEDASYFLANSVFSVCVSKT
jgi:hypothetical protein